MTASPSSAPAGENPDDAGLLNELRVELDQWGSPSKTPQKVRP